MKLFGGDTVSRVYNALGADENMPIQFKPISKAVESAQKKVEGNKLEINLASSGSVVASNIDLAGIECSLAGSGYIQIAGKADRAEYNLAASGNIKAYKCVTGKTECNIAGSGNIQTHTRNQLEANIVGSGNVYYKGNPTTSKSIIGSGKLKSAN